MQTRIIPMPFDFKVPFKEGFKFELTGMIMEVYEVKRAKPNPRFLIRAIGLVVTEEEAKGELVDAGVEGGNDGQSPAN